LCCKFFLFPVLLFLPNLLFLLYLPPPFFLLLMLVVLLLQPPPFIVNHHCCNACIHLLSDLLQILFHFQIFQE